MSRTDVVFFDPFETLGTEFASGRRRLSDYAVYPSARALLQRLSEHARLGVFSLDPDIPLRRLQRLLSSKGLVPPIDPDLVAVAQREDSTPFATLLADSGLTAEHVVFVSLDATQRTRALADHVRVAPHPNLAAAVLAGQSLVYARLSARDPGADLEMESLVGHLPTVPVFRTPAPDDSLYAITSSGALQTLSSPPLSEAFVTEQLGGPDAVSRTTLVLLQVTAAQASADSDLQEYVAGLADRDLPLVRETPGGWLIALPGDRSIEELHPPPAGSSHGHTLLLRPDALSWKEPTRRVDLAPRPLRSEERSALLSLDAAAIRRNLESWFEQIEPAEEPHA